LHKLEQKQSSLEAQLERPLSAEFGALPEVSTTEQRVRKRVTELTAECKRVGVQVMPCDD